MADLQLKFVKADGTPGFPLPSIVGDWSTSSVFCDVGAGSLSYRRAGKYAEMMEPLAEVVKLTNREERRNSRYMLWDFKDDLVKEGRSVRVRQWALVSQAYRFWQARINPAPGSPLALVRQMPEQTTYGAHLVTFIEEAYDRDALKAGVLAGGAHYTAITYDFDAELDSNGDPWEHDDLQPEVVCGSMVGDFLNWGTQTNVGEWIMEGSMLRAFNPDSPFFADHTVGDDRFQLTRGRDLTDGPVHAIVGTLATDVMVFGDADRFESVSDGDAITARGVREASINARGITRPGLLTRLGNQHLKLNNDVRRNRSYGLVLGKGHDPHVKFDEGEWVNVRDGGVTTLPVRMRVRGIVTISKGRKQVTAAIDVNDRVQERDIDILQRFNEINASTGGTDGGGRPNADTISPKAPGWPVSGSVTASLYDPPTGSGGARRAKVVLNWNDVTEDVDGIECFDLAGYTIHWRYTDAPAWGEQDVPPDPDTDVLDSTGQLLDLSPGKTIYAYVTAYDHHGNDSPASDVKTQALPTDRGSWRTFDVDGDLIMDTYDDAIRVYKTFVISAFADGSLGGLGVDATSEGIELEAANGLRTFGDSGVLGVWAKTNGDLEVHGGLLVDGNTVIGGTTTLEGLTTIDDDLIVNADTAVHGSLDVDGPATFSDTLDVGGVTHLGGALFLDADLDAQGFTIEGARLTTGTGNIIIDDDTITLGSAAMTFSGSLITVSGAFAAAGALSTSSTLDVTGTGTLNGALNVSGLATLSGNVKLGGSGNSVGFYGSSGAGFATVNPIVVATIANAATAINSMRNILTAKGLW